MLSSLVFFYCFPSTKLKEISHFLRGLDIEEKKSFIFIVICPMLENNGNGFDLAPPFYKLLMILFE
jgi:hypothetical protein